MPDPDGGRPKTSRAPLDEEIARRLQRAASLVRATRDAEAGTDSVYVALLQGVPGEDPFSFYVGMTSRDPDARYLEHLAGTNAGRGWIKKYGLGLLPGLVNRFNPMSRHEAQVVEMALLYRLCAARFHVHGA